MYRNIKQYTNQDGILSIIPLGGLGEIGRNMIVLEYKGKILIIDIGLRFPEEDMPGIDFIIPDIKYLEGKEKNILGVIFSHGHYDHIGAVPYLIAKLQYPRLFAAPLTAGIIKKRQEEFTSLRKLDIQTVKSGYKVNLGPFKVEFVKMTHNIPDTLGLFISTPVGNIFYTSDFKFDAEPLYDFPSDLNKLREIGKRKIMMLLSDSTGAENPGHSISEKTIQDNLEEIFKKAKGRIISATFASLINRVQQIIYLSEKYKRKVVIEGHSMKTNVEMSRILKYINVDKRTIISSKTISDYPDDKITVICTGAQGEERAVLMRIATKNHPHIKLKRGDGIIFSSSVIPGNERTVQILKDNLLRQGAKVFHYKMMDIHAGGHAQQDELKELIKIMQPRFFMPIHGQYSMLSLHGEIAKECGMDERNIAIIENGDAIRVNSRKMIIEKEAASSNYIMVDGLGVGDVGEVVLRDRQTMSKDGMFVIITVIDRKTGKVKGSPDIISRGFIYLRESKELLHETRRKVVEIVNHATSSNGAVNWVYVKDSVRNKIGDFLFQKTQRRPMVLPVVIEI